MAVGNGMGIGIPMVNLGLGGGGGGGSSFLLDDYPNTNGYSYSLRQLSSTVTNVVRVRRGSDNTEQDFTAAGITDGTLATFCGGVKGLLLNCMIKAAVVTFTILLPYNNLRYSLKMVLGVLRCYFKTGSHVWNLTG